jgi:hypothetical protein
VAEVRQFLEHAIDRPVCRAGITRSRLLVDPGFGFGKTLAHNLALLARLRRFRGPGRPVLVGLSRKSMLGAITGRAVGERLAASLAAAVLAVQRGARILRVHDVAETVDALGWWRGRRRRRGGTCAVPHPGLASLGESLKRKYFGTDGIRGGSAIPTISPDFVVKLGWAAGRVLGGARRQGADR